MYGDSGNDTPEHIEWAAFKKPNSTRLEDIRQHDAGTYKIWVMDVSNPEWKAHIFGQFADAMDKAGFDGIHLDNLGGEWMLQIQFRCRHSGTRGIPALHRRGPHRSPRKLIPRARLTHNDVMGNYLPEIARSSADVYYTEVWTRHSYRTSATTSSKRKRRATANPWSSPPISTASRGTTWAIPPQPPLPTFINDASAKLMDACIFAHGAFRIELGDDGQMLVNEYFPARTPRMHAGLKRAMRELL